MEEGGGIVWGWFKCFTLLRILFLLLLLHQLHLRLSGIRSQRSGTPASTTLSGFLEAAGQQAATQKGTFRHSGRSQGSSRDRSGGPGTERREAETVWVGDSRSRALDALFLVPPELHGSDSEEEREHLLAPPAAAEVKAHPTPAPFPGCQWLYPEPRTRTSQERTCCTTEILAGVGRRQPGARHPRWCSPNLAVQLAGLQLTNLLARLRSTVFPWGSVESVPLPSSGWSRLGWNPGTSPWPPVPLSLPPGLCIRETVDKARDGTQANTSMQ